MISLSFLGLTALIASSQSMALTPIADLSKADPCSLADIVWDGSTGPFDFTADQKTNLTTRSSHHRHFWTREQVVVEAGSSDSIVVDFDIKLSHNALQDAISIIKEDHGISLVIDGSKIETTSEPECIVATTSLKLPKKLHHLVFDVDNSPVRFKSVSSTFDTLDLYGKNGGFSFTSSDPTISELHADLYNGEYSFVSSHPTIALLDVAIKNGAFNAKEDSLITAEKVIIKSNNGPISARLSGVSSLEVTSNNGYVELELLDDDGSNTPTITTSSAHGRVQVKSQIKRAIDLHCTSQTGSVSADIVDNEGGTFHVQTRVGRPTVNGDVKVTKSKKTFTGLEIEGTFGSKGSSTIDLDVKVGSIKLQVRTESEESTIPIFGQEDDGEAMHGKHGVEGYEDEAHHGIWPTHGQGHPQRPTGFIHRHIVWILFIVVIAMAAWQNRKTSQRTRSGYQEISDIEEK